MVKLTFAATLVLIACTWTGARDAAALKADLQGMLPAGKTSMRLAWIKGGGWTEFAISTSNTVVYVVSSDDGIIRRLYPASGSGSYNSVNITADGSRVIFHNSNAGNLVVVNWDGSNAKTVNVGDKPSEYWRNPADGTDWAISETNGMSRVNIDNPSQKVSVAGWACSEDGCGLSDDGTKFYGFDYNRNPAAFGIVTVSSKQFTAGPHGGCQGSLGAGASPLYNHNPSGHTQMCVHESGDQTKYTMYPVMSTVKQSLQQKGLTGSCGGDNNEGTRFTQYPNYATFMIGNSKVNPILMRLPDMKFVYIEDGLACTFCGDMDAVFLPYTGIPGGTSVAGNRSVAAARSLNSDPVVTREVYLPDGRRVGPTFRSTGGSMPRGIVLGRTAKGIRAVIAE